jgi:hypothetical protein
MIRNDWTLNDVIDDYASYEYVKVYFMYVDGTTEDLFYSNSKSLCEDLFEWLDLDVVN